MRRSQPRRHIAIQHNKGILEGNALRRSYATTITENAPVLPKPLDYADIDTAFKAFVEKDIDVKFADGKPVPTFTLFSNQRFSEYSQTWKHVDEEDNLLMNFKTINREINPKTGDNQGGYWNIPGDRYYTVNIREVLDDNGTESYEVSSMKQPFAVDLIYRINVVTNLLENINEFNAKINDLFKARQCYIRPNGHWIPMIIEDVSDETQYNIEDRKFFVQTVTIKVMAYIIRKEDFKVERKPKRVMLFTEGYWGKKPRVSIEEAEAEYENIHQTADIKVNIEPWKSKIGFVFDSNMTVENIETENIRSMRLFINNNLTYWERPFQIHENDEIKIVVKQLDPALPSEVRISGFYNDIYVEDTPGEMSENVAEDVILPGHDHVEVE